LFHSAVRAATIATRTALSEPRRRVPSLRRPAVGIGGGTRIVADLGTPWGLALYRYGLRDCLSGLLRDVLRPGDAFVDGGAHVGLYTFLAAALVGPSGRVVAFEPALETMAMLRENHALNGFSWVTIHEVALADVQGRVPFWTLPRASGFSSLARPEVAGSRHVEVEITTLDDAVADLPRLKLVKLDLEGAECRAVRGAASLLEQTRPDFVIEVEPRHLARQGGSVAELQGLFADAHFVAFALDREEGRTILRRLGREWAALRPGEPNVVLRPLERCDESSEAGRRRE